MKPHKFNNTFLEKEIKIKTQSNLENSNTFLAGHLNLNLLNYNKKAETINLQILQIISWNKLLVQLGSQWTAQH